LSAIRGSLDDVRRDLPGRLLRLLSLLQSRRDWSGAELARRLEVTDRTVRRDIERLRELDYPVDSVGGVAGGYRLAAGANLPPLLLDDEEAVAVAVGLVTTGSEDAVRALAKLSRVLPARLRPRLAALTGAAVAVPHPHGVPVDANLLALLAASCRDHEFVSFDYRGRSATPSARRVEPHHLVTVQGLWYLVAYDPDRADWRTFRVDRIHRPTQTGQRFTPREVAPVEYLTGSFAAAEYRYTAWLTVALPAAAVREAWFTAIPGDITPDGPERCTVRLSTQTLPLLLQYVATVAALGAEFTLRADDEVTRAVAALGRALLHPSDDSGSASGWISRDEGS